MRGRSLASEENPSNPKLAEEVPQGPASARAEVNPSPSKRTTPPPIDPRSARTSGYHADRPGDSDQIGTIAGDVRAMAALILNREALAPLCIGLFGDWGSGKSLFMSLLKRDIATLGSARLDPKKFCTRVVHIDFNAWHYADANLWASLATHIFERVAQEVAAKDSEEFEARLLRGMRAYAELEKATEGQLAGVARDIAARRRELAELDALLDAARALGLRPDADVAKVRAALERSSGPLAVLGGALRGRGWLVALAAALSLYYAEPLGRWLQVLSARLDGLIASAQELGAGVARLFALLSSGFLLWRGERTRRALRRADQASAAPLPEGAGLEAARDEAREALQALRGQRERLERERAGRDPKRAFRRFLAGTGSEARYGKARGLIADIHRDFSQLREHIRHAEKAGSDDFLRIVLYIDDLDRCRPRRVVEVLEAIHLLLATDLFVVVVAVDPRWLEQALRTEYHELLRQRPDEDGRATARDYLEKIVQIPYCLPRMREQDVARFTDTLLSRAKTTRDVAPAPRTVLGPAAEVGPEEQACLGKVAVLFETPRAVKRFVNVYRLLRGMLQVTPDFPEHPLVQLLLAKILRDPASGSELVAFLGGWSVGKLGDWLREKRPEEHARLTAAIPEVLQAGPLDAGWLRKIRRFGFHA